jgi:hypothetical protein
MTKKPLTAPVARLFRAGTFISLFTMSMLGATPLLPSVRADESQAKQEMPAGELVQQVVRNELNAQDQDKSLWKYREIRQEEGRTELREIVETRDGEVHRVLAVNGKPLSEKQREIEERRIQGVLANPNEFRERQENAAHDAEQERQLLRMLPQAFLYSYSGIGSGSIRLKFRPNPQFHATNHESEVFHHMEGEILVNARQHRLAEIDGRLLTEVKFWDGLLGHLDKGGTFCVKQRNIGGGHWEMTELDVEMNGKALFFKTIAVHQKQTDSDFHPLPDHTTLKQAGELLAINMPN